MSGRARDPMLDQLISGGQTGVDRAALDVAFNLGLTIGGGCLQGRRAEDSLLPNRYPRVETPEPDDETRTHRHVEESDGTPILNLGKLDGGTAATADHARRIGQPCPIVALEEGTDPARFRDWPDENCIRNSLKLWHDESCPRLKAVRTLAIEKNDENEGEI